MAGWRGSLGRKCQLVDLPCFGGANFTEEATSPLSPFIAFQPHLSQTFASQLHLKLAYGVKPIATDINSLQVSHSNATSRVPKPWNPYKTVLVPNTTHCRANLLIGRLLRPVNRCAFGGCRLVSFPDETLKYFDFLSYFLLDRFPLPPTSSIRRLLRYHVSHRGTRCSMGR